jgi:hypothetical protein
VNIQNARNRNCHQNSQKTLVSKFLHLSRQQRANTIRKKYKPGGHRQAKMYIGRNIFIFHSRPAVSTTQMPSRMSAAAWRPNDPCNRQHKPVVIKCCHASIICSSSSHGINPSAMPTAS